MPYLPNGHQVVLEGFGHSFTFWTEQPEAGTRLISTFLDRGQVDDSLYQPQRIDFTPSPTGRGIAPAQPEDRGVAGLGPPGRRRDHLGLET